MTSIAAQITQHELATLRQVKGWVDEALGDPALLTDEDFGALVTFMLDKRIFTVEEMMVLAAASKSQISRWRNSEGLPSDRHKKEGVLRDLRRAIEDRERSAQPKTQRRKKVGKAPVKR